MHVFHISSMIYDIGLTTNPVLSISQHQLNSVQGYSRIIGQTGWKTEFLGRFKANLFLNLYKLLDAFYYKISARNREEFISEHLEPNGPAFRFFPLFTSISKLQKDQYFFKMHRSLSLVKLLASKNLYLPQHKQH